MTKVEVFIYTANRLFFYLVTICQFVFLHFYMYSNKILDQSRYDLP